MTNDVTVPQPDGAVPAEVIGTPGDALRALPAEAEQRGSRFVSAQAMQARLFSVYDADEVEAMASQLDALLMLDAAERIEDGAAVGDGDLASVGPEE